MPSRTEGDRIIHRPFDRSDVPVIVVWLIIIAILIDGLIRMAIQ